MAVEFPATVLGVLGQNGPSRVPAHRSGQAEEAIFVVHIRSPRLLHTGKPTTIGRSSQGNLGLKADRPGRHMGTRLIGDVDH